MSHPDSESLYDVSASSLKGWYLGSVTDDSGENTFDAVKLGSGETVFVSPTETVGSVVEHPYSSPLPWRTGGTVAEGGLILQAADERRFLGIAFTSVLHNGQDSVWTVAFDTTRQDGVEPGVEAAVVWRTNQALPYGVDHGPDDVAALVEENGDLALETYDAGARIGRAFLARSNGHVDDVVVSFGRGGRDVTVLDRTPDGLLTERARLERPPALPGQLLLTEARVTHGGLTVQHVRWAVAPDRRYSRAPRLNRSGLVAAAGDPSVGLSIDGDSFFFQNSPDGRHLLKAHGGIIVPGLSTSCYVFQKVDWEQERWKYYRNAASRHQIEASLDALGIRYLSGITADKAWAGGLRHPGYREYLADVLAPHQGDGGHGVVLMGAVDWRGFLEDPDFVADLARLIRQNGNVPYIYSGDRDHGFQMCDTCLKYTRNFAKIAQIVPEIGGAVVVVAEHTQAPAVDAAGDQVAEVLRGAFDEVIFAYVRASGPWSADPQAPEAAVRAVTRLAARYAIPLTFKLDAYNVFDSVNERDLFVTDQGSFTYVPNEPYYQAVIEELKAARKPVSP